MSVTTTQGSALVSFIERASADPTFDVAKFGELLKLQREVERDMAKRAFHVAMAQAQGEMEPIRRDAVNKHLGNRYAKLETIDAQIRPIYTRHGFSVYFGSAPSPNHGDLRITITVAHDAGHYKEDHLDAPVGNVGAQGGRTQTTPVQSVGSAITYLRRYLLCMAFNIVTEEDDDGSAAPPPRQQQRPDPGVYEQRQQPPKGRTMGDFLDGVEIALKDAKSHADVNRILDREDVLKAISMMQEGPSLTRFTTMKQAALERHPPPVPEEDGWPGPDVPATATA